MYSSKETTSGVSKNLASVEIFYGKSSFRVTLSPYHEGVLQIMNDKNTDVQPQ